MTTKKVYKIPDGNGGITYQTQSSDGKWHITDENGNPISEECAEQDSDTNHNLLKNGMKIMPRRKKNVSSADGLSYVQYSIKIPNEEYKILSSYVYWRNLVKGKISRAELLLQVCMDVIRKDKEFWEFIKKSPEIGR